MLSAWSCLPGLCCQAAGGQPDWADAVTSAWFLLYAAADLMDSVEDQDLEDAPQETSSSRALSAASGLYFSASLALTDLFLQQQTCSCAATVMRDFYTAFIQMCSGQHGDLTHPEPSLEEYWRITAAKSGIFFSLGCRAGASLATQDPVCLQGYSQFGYHFGLLVQVLDDLDDLQCPPDGIDTGWSRKASRSLPVAYARSVFPRDHLACLEWALQASCYESSAIEEILGLLDQGGAVLYLMAEIERHKALALSALESANPRSPAREELLRLTLARISSEVQKN